MLGSGAKALEDKSAPGAECPLGQYI